MTLTNKSRETWLHGWPRMGTEVLVGTGVWCVGCGKDQGITTVAFDESWEYWVKDRPYPDWPFDQETCPICYLADLYMRCKDGMEREWIQVGKDGMPIRDLRNRLPK